jgi:hypothetical protein
MNKLIVLLTIISSVYCQYNPGGVVAVNTIFVENHKGAIANAVIKILNTVDIPDITSDSPDLSVHVYNNTYAIAPVHRSQVTVIYEEENNAIVFKITDMTAKFHSNKTDIKKGILQAHGTLDALMTDMTIFVGIQMSTIQ